LRSVRWERTHHSDGPLRRRSSTNACEALDIHLRRPEATAALPRFLIEKSVSPGPGYHGLRTSRFQFDPQIACRSRQLLGMRPSISRHTCVQFRQTPGAVTNSVWSSLCTEPDNLTWIVVSVYTTEGVMGTTLSFRGWTNASHLWSMIARTMPIQRNRNTLTPTSGRRRMIGIVSAIGSKKCTWMLPFDSRIDPCARFHCQVMPTSCFGYESDPLLPGQNNR